MKKLMIVFVIILAATLKIFIALICVVGFMICVPRQNVSTNIDIWVELQEVHSYLPAINEMGHYQNIQCKYQHKEGLLYTTDTYILRASYSQEDFSAQKDYVLNTYYFQDTVTDKIGEKTIQKNADFLFDDYDFKMLSFKEYELFYPKYFVFVGFSEENREICFIYFEDFDLDYISGSFEDFLIDECGWE